MKRLILFIFILSSINSFGQGDLTKVRFTPHWTPQSQFAGYYVAKELGFYEDVGLDVEIIHPTQSLSAVELLKTGETDIISTMLIEAVLNNERYLNDTKGKKDGVELVNIMQIVPQTTMVLVTHEPYNNVLEKLRNKKVSIWRVGFTSFITGIFEKEGIDVDWIKILSGVNVFLSGSVDGTIAMYYNELQTILETGREISDKQIIRFPELGYDIPEDGVYTDMNFAKNNGEALKKFKKATIKGWMWAVRNQEETVKYVIKYALENELSTNRYHQAAMLQALKECHVGDNEDSFNFTEEKFNDAIALLKELDIISTNFKYNEFVIGE